MILEAVQTVQGVDAQLLLWLNGMHNEFFDNFMSYATGKLVWVPMYVCIFYVMLKNYTWRTLVLMLAAIALTITFCDQICASVIRPLVERPRPSAEGSPIADLVHIVNGRRGGSYGFPSCHAANTFGLAFFLMLLMGHRTLNVCMFAWALINSYSRIYLGLHYPGDILAGAVVGLVGACLFFCIAERQVRDHLCRPARYTEFITGMFVIIVSFIVLFSVIPLEKVFPSYAA
jgi:undecaprenyl-diphosphatase